MRALARGRGRRGGRREQKRAANQAGRAPHRRRADPDGPPEPQSPAGRSPDYGTEGGGYRRSDHRRRNEGEPGRRGGNTAAAAAPPKRGGRMAQARGHRRPTKSTEPRRGFKTGGRPTRAGTPAPARGHREGWGDPKCPTRRPGKRGGPLHRRGAPAGRPDRRTDATRADQAQRKGTRGDCRRQRSRRRRPFSGGRCVWCTRIRMQQSCGRRMWPRDGNFLPLQRQV